MILFLRSTIHSFAFIPPPSKSYPSTTKKVTSVACGENHTLYVTKQGKTFGMGSNAWCQIAQKEPWETGVAAFNSPENIAALARKKIASVVCGNDFSLALAETGELYSWGFGRWGQLGDGQGKHVKSKPLETKRAPFGGKDGEAAGAQIACGADHCVAALRNGQIWTWVVI